MKDIFYFISFSEMRYQSMQSQAMYLKLLKDLIITTTLQVILWVVWHVNYDIIFHVNHIKEPITGE